MVQLRHHTTCDDSRDACMRSASPLLALRDWFTVDEAALRLSELLRLESGMTGADVLRLALDGHLALSVNMSEVDALGFEHFASSHPTIRKRISGVWDLPLVDEARRQVE